jgi:hypothetical protein
LQLLLIAVTVLSAVFGQLAHALVIAGVIVTVAVMDTGREKVEDCIGSHEATSVGEGAPPALRRVAGDERRTDGATGVNPDQPPRHVWSPRRCGAGAGGSAGAG